MSLPLRAAEGGLPQDRLLNPCRLPGPPGQFISSVPFFLPRLVVDSLGELESRAFGCFERMVFVLCEHQAGPLLSDGERAACVYWADEWGVAWIILVEGVDLPCSAGSASCGRYVSCEGGGGLGRSGALAEGGEAMMEYKGYIGKVEDDDEAGIFHGEVINTRDVITFQGQSVVELTEAFGELVDDYLAFCKERGRRLRSRSRGSL